MKINAELDRCDVVNLLKGVSEYVPEQVACLKGRFRGGGNGTLVWVWNEDYLKNGHLLEMYKHYQQIKKTIPDKT